MAQIGDIVIELSAKLDNLTTGFNRAERHFDRFERQTQKVGRALQTFERIAGSVGLAVGAGQLLRTADQYQVLQRRIETATKQTGDFVAVNEELRRIANTTGSALSDNVGVFQSLARSATELGATNTEVLQLTETVQQLGVIGGATTQGMSAGLMQFSQGLAGGVFRAEEFNSILENLPEVANRIAEGMNKTVGELRRAVLAGEVLSKDVFQSLLKQSDRISREFGEMPLSLAQSFQVLQNEFERTIGQADKQLGVTSTLAAAMRTLAENLDTVVQITGLAAAAIGTRLVAAVGASTTAFIAGQVQAVRYQFALASMAGVSKTAAVGQLSLAAATRGASAAMALLGGPAGIALIAAGSLAFLATRQTEAGKAADAARNATEELNRILGNSAPMSKEAARSAIELASANLKQAETALAAAEAEQQKFIAQAGGPAAASRMLGTGAISTSGQQRRIETLRGETEALRDTLNRASNELELVINGPGGVSGGAAESAISAVSKGLSESEKAAQRLQSAFESTEDSLRRQIILYGETSESARLRYEFEFGALRDLDQKQQNQLMILAKRKDLMDAQAEAAQEAARKQQEAQDKVNRKLEESKRFANDLGLTFSSAFERAITQAESFRDVLGGLARDMVAIFTRKTVTEPLAAGISNIASGIDFGSIFGGIFHEGGIVGQGGPGRMVPAMAFAGAPRYHTGGLSGFRPDERPAVLQVGEEVLRRDDPRHRNNQVSTGGKSMSVTINQSYDFRGANNPAQLRAEAERIKQETLAAVEAGIERGGRMSRAVGRRI